MLYEYLLLLLRMSATHNAFKRTNVLYFHS